RARATDVDGYRSQPSPSRGFRITADEPPSATIRKPDNQDSAIIRGQPIEVLAEARDDLGPRGIERVVFYMNGSPV
ncbi:MAG: hypothetical protein ABEK42_01795, partial [Thiohalorhabdaceae bacterium]